MFEKLEKAELKAIYLNYLHAKESGYRCEDFVPYAEEYRCNSGMGENLSMSVALDIVKQEFMQEVMSRYFFEKNF